MLLGLIIIIYQEKLTNFPLKNEFLAPNKRAGRNFSSKLINVQFLIRRVGRKKSQKLIKCAARLFHTTEYFFGRGNIQKLNYSIITITLKFL